MCATSRSWCGEAAPAAFYRFSVDRKGRHPKAHLTGFSGWMHADGYAGFEDLYRSGRVREVACMAHIRRKFVDVHKSQGSPIAEEAIRRIAALYAIEKHARGSPPDRRAEIRQARARPIFDDLEAWLGVQLSSISRKSPLAGAIRYALTRMPRLRPYLANGRLELDNNPAERAMRAIALGRKNSHDRRQGCARTSPSSRSCTGKLGPSPMGWCRALRSQRRLLKLSFGDLACAAP